MVVNKFSSKKTRAEEGLLSQTRLYMSRGVPLGENAIWSGTYPRDFGVGA